MSGERVAGLRAGVTLEVAADGTGALSDPLLGRRIKLDARGVAVCGALVAGDRDADEVVAASGASLEVVKSFTAKLVSLDLCATARAGVRAAERTALSTVRQAPALHLRPLPGARFGCTMCGSCCGGHNVAPVSGAVISGLDAALDVLEPAVRAARRVDKDLFVRLPGERGTPGRDVMCHASNGSCVFLDDGGKCRIHALVGGDKKPLPCRIFPWEIVATPSGVRISVQRECRDFARAIGDASPSLEDATAELSALVAAIPELPTVRPVPRCRGRELESWAAWEDVERAMLAVVDASDGADPSAIFRALTALLPGAAIASTSASTPTHDAAPRFGDWRDSLASILGQMLQAAPPPSAKMVIRVDAARIALTALESARGWVLARALEPLAGASARLFKEHLRHALWATTPLRAPSIEAGLARMFAEWVLARLVAVGRAREVKRFHVTDQDLQDGLVTASFLFRHEDLQPVLAELDALTTAVFVDGLDVFLREAPDDDEPDQRFELVKF